MSNPKHAFALCLSLAAALFCGCELSPPPRPALQSPSTQYVREMVEYLSADRMQGRGVGTAGLEEAAGYIAGRFHQLDLEYLPGQTSYFQPFPFTTVIGVDAAKTTLTLGNKTLTLDKDFVTLPNTAEKDFDGPLTFAGYGVAYNGSPTTRPYDDFAELDLKGKVVVVLRFEPHDENGNSRLTGTKDYSPAAALFAKGRAAASKGAVAVLVVHPPNHRGPDALTPFTRDRPLPIPMLQITQAAADDMFQQASDKPLLKAVAGVQEEIDSRFTPSSSPLNPLNAKGNVAFKRVTHDLRNVHAVLPGKGKHADRYIVIGAHYDHLGKGATAGHGAPATRPNEVFNGADDNASGTAAMLELARLFKNATPLPRSILFVGFSAEEQGLIGSQYWVNHAPVPLSRIDAMINLDMVGRLPANNTVLVGGRNTAAPFPDIVAAIDAASPLRFTFDRFDNGLAPSDITSFVQKKVPGLFFWTGTHPDYHRWSDDADKVNYDGLSEIIKAVGQTVVALAYRDDIAFQQPATRPTTGVAATQPGDDMLKPGGASLGVMPDYASAESKDGVKISGASPNSAAARAGLQPDDVLTELGDKKLVNLYDLMEALNALTPGKPVKLKLIRSGKPIEVEVVPTERQTRN